MSESLKDIPGQTCHPKPFLAYSPNNRSKDSQNKCV